MLNEIKIAIGAFVTFLAAGSAVNLATAGSPIGAIVAFVVALVAIGYMVVHAMRL